jgi:nucleotide-binding universal stress UspA family protein
VFKTVIWATDGSDEALVALPLARELAGERDAHLAVVHAYEVVPSRGGAFMRQLDELDVQEQLRDHVEWLRSDGVDANFILASATASDPARKIADVAREIDADIIVIGHRRRPAIASLLRGSVARRLVRSAPCPVLIAPATTLSAAVDTALQTRAAA